MRVFLNWKQKYMFITANVFYWLYCIAYYYVKHLKINQSDNSNTTEYLIQYVPTHKKTVKLFKIQNIWNVITRSVFFPNNIYLIKS